MNSLKRRVSKIFKRTHIFISNAEFRPHRDFLKAKLEELKADPSTYKTALENLEKLWRDVVVSDQKEEKLNIWREQAKRNGLPAHIAFCIKKGDLICKHFPIGVWLDSTNGARWLKDIAEARAYFERNNSLKA